MSLKKNITPAKSDAQKKTPMSKENENKYHLLKDFKTPVSTADFISEKEDDKLYKNFGIFDDIIPLMNKNNKKIYYLKVIEKKNIINKSYQSYLNSMYTLSSLNKICAT